MHGRVDAIQVLVQHGASVRAADTRGHFTPLHLAADAGQCEAISTLLALRADIEARTVKGFSPLVLAVMKVRTCCESPTPCFLDLNLARSWLCARTLRRAL